MEKELLAKYFKFNLCDYKCEKHAALNKHLKSKHTDQKYKVCSKYFKASMEPENYVAREHHNQEEARNTQCQSTPKEDKEGKLLSFVFNGLTTW